MAIDDKVVFDSRYRYENVAVKDGTPFSLSGSFSSTTLTIPHGLGYVPYVKAWYTFGSGQYYPVWTGSSSYAVDGNDAQIDDFYADATNLYFTVSLGFTGGSVSGTLYYRIYAEPS